MIKSSKDFIRTKGWECGNFQPGPTNSIMDVNGLKVGHSTIISGSGILKPGKGPIRTGISVILPHTGNLCQNKSRVSYFIVNGYGKSLGLMLRS